MIRFDCFALLAPFLGPAAVTRTPALVIVHTDDAWRQYTTLLELADPDLDSPYIFALSMGTANDRLLATHFPSRQVFQYYPLRPGEILLEALP